MNKRKIIFTIIFIVSLIVLIISGIIYINYNTSKNQKQYQNKLAETKEKHEDAKELNEKNTKTELENKYTTIKNSENYKGIKQLFLDYSSQSNLKLEVTSTDTDFEDIPACELSMMFGKYGSLDGGYIRFNIYIEYGKLDEITFMIHQTGYFKYDKANDDIKMFINKIYQYYTGDNINSDFLTTAKITYNNSSTFSITSNFEKNNVNVLQSISTTTGEVTYSISYNLK